MNRVFFSILLYFVFCFTPKAQNTSADKTDANHRYITARMMGGLVIPHHTTMLYFIDDFASSIELNYGYRQFDSNKWEAFFNYPEIGLGFYYGTFGNKDVYGEGYALFPYIQYNIFRSPRFAINNKVAMGLGYATKPFHIENNTYNLVFSTHFNIYIGLGLSMDYRISDRFSASLSGDLTHMSNGAAKKPNHGINVLTASVGAKYHFNKELTPEIKKVKAPKSSERELLIIGSLGRSQSSTFNPEKFWNASLNINYIWHLNKKRGVGIGLDQIYSEAIPHAWQEFDNFEDQSPYSTKDYLITGLFASYNAYLGKTNLFANLGVYIYHNIKPPQPIYPRIGIRYSILPNLIANFSVKASFFRSEFLEFGIGYRLKHAKKS